MDTTGQSSRDTASQVSLRGLLRARRCFAPDMKRKAAFQRRFPPAKNYGMKLLTSFAGILVCATCPNVPPQEYQLRPYEETNEIQIAPSNESSCNWNVRLSRISMSSGKQFDGCLPLLSIALLCCQESILHELKLAALLTPMIQVQMKQVLLFAYPKWPAKSWVAQLLLLLFLSLLLCLFLLLLLLLLFLFLFLMFFFFFLLLLLLLLLLLSLFLLLLLLLFCSDACFCSCPCLALALVLVLAVGGRFLDDVYNTRSCLLAGCWIWWFSIQSKLSSVCHYFISCFSLCINLYLYLFICSFIYLLTYLLGPILKIQQIMFPSNHPHHPFLGSWKRSGNHWKHVTSSPLSQFRSLKKYDIHRLIGPKHGFCAPWSLEPCIYSALPPGWVLQVFFSETKFA